MDQESPDPAPGQSAAPDWQAQGSCLGLILPSGMRVLPSAAEIVGAEFKGRLTIRGETVSRPPSEALTHIQFSKYPLDAAIQVTPPSSDLATPAGCALVLRSGGKVYPVAGPANGRDQLLTATEWFPVSGDTINEVASILAKAGIHEPGRLGFRQYFELRRQDADFLIIQDAPAPVIEPEQESPSRILMPEGLVATLYPYQETGFDWLSRVSEEGIGCILGDEMGLGKTLQVIALLVREKHVRKTPSVVIAPATLLENWRRELARFAPGLTLCVHRGQGRTGFPKILRSFDVVITSYETATRDISIFEMIGWNVAVLDEAQAIKTPDAQRTIILKSLPRRMAIAVSGTPVENSLRDLWSLLDFAVPGMLGTLPEFEARYTDSVEDAAELEPLVSPLILRRRVSEVAKDLPERIDIPQPVELSEVGAQEYESIRAAIFAEYGAAASLVALGKLRMFCAHPFLVNGGSGDPLPHSTKYARLLELLDEIFSRGEKVLIFTSYTAMADLIGSDVAKRYGVPATIIDGRTPVPDRQPTVDRFGQVMTAAALVLNPKAAGVGLNITAANHVIHYNLEWNPALEDQATARAFRRGQKRPVTVHRLFHPGTVEDIIVERTERKRALAAGAVTGNEGDDESLTDVLRALQLSPLLERKEYVRATT